MLLVFFLFQSETTCMIITVPGVVVNKAVPYWLLWILIAILHYFISTFPITKLVLHHDHCKHCTFNLKVLALGDSSWNFSSTEGPFIWSLCL